jgi:DNA-directed RNA polymerase subunit RPC12/RpoP
VLCCSRIGDEYCPLEDAREVDGPKLHPGCWDAFFADEATPRCEWCYREVQDADATPGSAAEQAHAHPQLPQGGAAGAMYGKGRRLLHQQCVDAYNAARGSSCMHCGRPVHVGLDVAGLGLVHKGYCYGQMMAQLDEERAKAAAELTAAEVTEYSCAACARLIDALEEFYTLEDGTTKMHVGCWDDANSCAAPRPHRPPPVGPPRLGQRECGCLGWWGPRGASSPPRPSQVRPLR